MKSVQIIGAFFTLILGTLLHFTYDWSGKNAIVGMVSAVNESTWEHLKMLAMPMLIFTMAEYGTYGRKIANFIPVKAGAVLLGMSLIVVLFYTYVGIIGKHFLWADIGTFVVGVVAAYGFSTHFLHTNLFSSTRCIRWGWIGLVGIAVCFAWFTFFPPSIGLFSDPTEKSRKICSRNE